TARRELVAQAGKAAKKRPAVPEALGWLSWSELPPVRWAPGTREDDAGPADLVPEEVIRHLAVQAVRARSAEPDAVLRGHVDLFEPGDRVAFGAALFG